VAVVQRGYLGQLEALSEGDDERVCGSKRKVAVCDNHLGHSCEVAGRQLDGGEIAIGQ